MTISLGGQEWPVLRWPPRFYVGVKLRVGIADMLYIVDMDRVRTDFLFAQPSFLSGFARLLDLFGLFDSYNESRSPKEADAKAMYADWRITGQDIFDAAIEFEHTELQSNDQKDDRQLTLFAG